MAPLHQRKGSISSESDVPKPRGRHKRGKRIVQLLQRQQDGLKQQQLQHQHQQQAARRRGSNPRKLDQPAFKFTAHGPTAALPAPVMLIASKGRACLLDVPGLTREALDDCIATFFTSIEPAYRLSQTRHVFLSRVRVLLYDLAGADIPNDLADVAPASELLVLAVACLGAPLSAHPEVTQPLYDQCRALAHETGYLDDSTLDNVEAVNLLESAVFQPQSLEGGEEQHITSHPLKLDPLGKGNAITLALYYNLNVPPVDTDDEYERRRKLFWILWELDALRMASARIPYRLADTDIGWTFPANSSDAHQGLARVARQICSAALSIRAKTVGIREADLFAAVSALDSLDLNDGLDGVSGQEPISPKNLFLQSTRNLLYLVCWVAAKDNGLPSHVVASLEESTMRATERMAYLAQAVTSHQLLTSAPRAVRDHLAAFILFLIRRLAEPQRSPSDAVQYFALAETLGRAVRSATVYRDSERLADVLRDAVYKASRNMSCVAPDPVASRPEPSRQLSGSIGQTPAPQAAAPLESSEADLFSNLLLGLNPDPTVDSLLSGSEPLRQQSFPVCTDPNTTPPDVESHPLPQLGAANMRASSSTARVSSEQPSLFPDSAIPLLLLPDLSAPPNLALDDKSLTDFLVSFGIGGPAFPST